MSKRADQKYLLDRQYRDATNLKARINLHLRFGTNPYDWFRFVFDQFDLPASAAILELGCGPGTLWVKNLDRIPTGWDVTLSDFSSGMVEEAEKNLSQSNRIFNYKIIDAQELPIPDQHLDAIIANHMLYHVPDRSKAISEIHRVLKPGGYLFAATNGENHLSELDDLYDELQPELRHTIDRNFSANTFTLENGSDQLIPWFTVVIRYYEDSLEVTEIDPLIAYLKSMIPFEDYKVSQEQLDSLYTHLEKRIHADGCFRITKSTGIFVARKNSV